MKVSQEEWKRKLDNLNRRRQKEVIKNQYPQVDDYCSHVNKCQIGESVLDVGCGLQIIKDCLPPSVKYTGIDPSVIKEGTINMTIEDCNFPDESFDTLYCFATLDGVMDLQKTVSEMKRVCKKNIVYLQGIDIEPDQFHTFKISEKLLKDLMLPMTVGHYEWLTDKVLLIEFLK